MTRQNSREFLVRKVSMVLDGHVEWLSDEPRQRMDQLEAERIVDEKLEWMLRRMMGDPLPEDGFAKWLCWEISDDASFDLFDARLGWYVFWQCVSECFSGLPRPPYGETIGIVGRTG